MVDDQLAGDDAGVAQACPGRRLSDRALLGICICCDRQSDDADSRERPPAVQQGGTWRCPQRVDEA